MLVVDWVMRLAPAPSDSTPPFGWSPGGLLGHLEGLAGHLEACLVTWRGWLVTWRGCLVPWRGAPSPRTKPLFT